MDEKDGPMNGAGWCGAGWPWNNNGAQSAVSVRQYRRKNQ